LLLGSNPLRHCKRPREKEERILRPRASRERFDATLAKADEVDATGRFRLALTIARYTARRVDAVLHLRASDLLLTEARARAALANAGQDESAAAKWPHGAIRWAPEFDKMRTTRITPIGPTLRAEVDRYFKVWEDEATKSEVWLFRQVDENKPVTRNVANRWLREAERLAGLPKLRGGLWHSYRRLWATERKDLPDADVAKAGGWTGTRAMKAAYQQDTVECVFAAVVRE
jgi:hypothetical protein